MREVGCGSELGEGEIPQVGKHRYGLADRVWRSRITISILERLEDAETSADPITSPATSNGWHVE